MAKRTKGPEQLHDYHPTPPEAVAPLVRVLPPRFKYVEPCAGDGRLVEALKPHVCVRAYDLHPRASWIEKADALGKRPIRPVITNPPYREDYLNPLMYHWLILSKQRAILLLPLDMIANLWFQDYSVRVFKILPVGRVSWMGNKKGG